MDLTLHFYIRQKNMILISRRELFNAAHNLYNPNWTEEKNFEVFGPCSRIHGHNWELIVTVKGEINPETGYVMDLKMLRDIIREHITEHVDHRYLNHDVPFLKGILPSTENLAVNFWEILQPLVEEISGVKLHCVMLRETPNHHVEYYG
jgi:6-pyruvoyltetrahydropterin/6-carboxytetrahydropterin synthase